MSKVFIDGCSLTLDDFVNVARHGYQVELTDESKISFTFT